MTEQVAQGWGHVTFDQTVGPIRTLKGGPEEDGGEAGESAPVYNHGLRRCNGGGGGGGMRSESGSEPETRERISNCC